MIWKQAVASSNDSEEELAEELPDHPELPDQPEHIVGRHSKVMNPAQEQEENLTPHEPQLYVCDYWIRPVEVMTL